MLSNIGADQPNLWICCHLRWKVACVFGDLGWDQSLHCLQTFFPQFITAHSVASNSASTKKSYKVLQVVYCCVWSYSTVTHVLHRKLIFISIFRRGKALNVSFQINKTVHDGEPFAVSLVTCRLEFCSSSQKIARIEESEKPTTYVSSKGSSSFNSMNTYNFSLI